MRALKGISGLHVLICLAGLGLYAWGFRAQTDIAGLPPDFDRSALSYPVHVGDRVAATGEELRYIAEGSRAGTRLEIVEADGRTRPVVLELGRDRAYLWITALSASVFWIFSLLAFAPRVHIPGGVYFFWTIFLYGLAVSIGGAYFGGARPWHWSLPSYLHVITLAAIPVIFVQMTTVFPRRSSLRDRLPWLLPALWSSAVVLAAWQIVAFHSYFGRTTPDRAVRMHTAGFVADLVLVAETAAGMALLIWQGRTAPLARERSQVRWLLRGFLIGVAPYVFLRTLPTAFGLPALFPHHVDRLVELTIPAALTIVVVRHQLLDMDVNVRRGLLYGVLANMLLVGYVFIVLLVKPIPIGVAPWISSLLWVMLGIGGGLLVGPLRRTVASWMDRHLFHILHDHEALLEDLDRSLDRADDSDAVLRAIRTQLAAAFRPRRMTIIADEGKEIRVNGRTGEEDARVLIREWVEFSGSRLRAAAAPGSTDDPASEVADFPASLRERGFVLGASIRSGESVTGLVLLGPRASRRHYVRRQLRLFGTIAEHAGVRLVRIELMRRVLEEQADRRRLAELHRAKTEFLARVAHDLRTPRSTSSLN